MSIWHLHQINCVEGRNQALSGLISAYDCLKPPEILIFELVNITILDEIIPVRWLLTGSHHILMSVSGYKDWKTFFRQKIDLKYVETQSIDLSTRSR